MLPQRVTSVSRQGVNYTILDNQDFVEEMRTGLYVVDLFLKSVNPDKARAKARVFSPDVPRARRMVPKPLPLGQSVLDMYITGQEGGVLDVNLDYINAGFLASDDTWVPTLKIANYTGTKSKELANSAVQFNDPIVTDVTKNVSFRELTDGIVTITTSTAHGFVAGDLVTIAGINSTFNGSYYIVDVPSSDTFTYARQGYDDVPYGADTGTATVSNESRDSITLTGSYDDAYAYVGFVDPGTWDLYASRPDPLDETATETIYIASGNLALRLGKEVIPTYTLGE